jgi:outer membrane receptor protein involved in Fe transport
VTGAYYEHDRTDEMTTAVRADDVTGIAACYTIATCTPLGLREPGFSVPGLVPASNVKNTSIADETVNQWAVYAQADYHILHNLTATAGIRYYSANIFNYGVAIQNIAPDWAIGKISTPAVNQDDHASQHSPSYNFSLLYKPTSDLSIYGRIASGFRIGGTNNVAALASQVGVSIPGSYGSDKLWDYEIGAKAYLAQHRLYLDGTIYQMNWTGQQLSATDPTGAFSYVLNAGKTRIRGAEFKATYSLPDGLSFGGGITYTDAVLRSDLSAAVVQAGTIGLKGDRLPRVPHWTFAGQAEYDYRLDDRRSLYAQSNFSYRGSSYYSFDKLNAFDEKLPSYFLLGLRLGYRTGPFDASFFINNLTNKVAIVGMDSGTHGVKVFSDTPRTIGARFQANF